jgi:hypothetical protein
MSERDHNAAGQVAVDASAERLRSEAEVECAIDTILTFAFGQSERLETYVFRVRAALPQEPTVLEIVDAVFEAKREMGPISDEAIRRADAGMAMAAFLSVEPQELGLPAAMFRVGNEVWLTPARAALS